MSCCSPLGHPLDHHLLKLAMAKSPAWLITSNGTAGDESSSRCSRSDGLETQPLVVLKPRRYTGCTVGHLLAAKRELIQGLNSPVSPLNLTYVWGTTTRAPLTPSPLLRRGTETLHF